MKNSADIESGVLPKGKVKVPHPPEPEGRTPVRVNGIEIGEEEIRSEMQNHRASNPEQAREMAIRALVVRELLVQEAAAENIVAEPRILGDGLKEIEADAAIRALLDEQVSTPRADEAACRRYYDSHREKFSSQTIYEARHILIAATPSNEERRKEARKTASMIIKKLQDNPGIFPELAKTHSACPSKQQGGNLGQLGKGATVAEFETVLFQMDEGQLWPVPVPTQFGYHVIRLDKIIQGEQLPFEAARQKIAAWLEASSWSRAVAQYISILAGKADIQGFDMEGARTPLVQ